MKNTITYIAILIGITGYAQLETINISYEYDNLNRLVQVVSNEGDGFENNYEYDNLGNRISKEQDNSSNPNLTYVPDDAFEQKLINEGYDDVMDDYVVTANIANLTFLFASGLGIEETTGIEDFSSMETLYFNDNEINEIDISQNSQLDFFQIAGNNLTTINISNNPLLESLDVSDNELITVDISNNQNMFFLSCDNNQITNLDLSNNTALGLLNAHYNNLTGLDVSQNSNLSYIWVRDNPIEELDFTNNPLLNEVNAENCLSLTSLNVKNGNNIILTQFEADNSPNLFCIQVDDENAANSGSGVYGDWEVDAQVTFSEDCTLGINDNNIVNEIIITPNPASNLLSVFLPDSIISNRLNIKIYDINGRIVFDEEFNSQNQQIDVSVKSLAQGIYSIEVKNDTQLWVKQFIKN